MIPHAQLTARWQGLEDHAEITYREAAGRLGVTEAALTKAIQRSRDAGLIPQSSRRLPFLQRRAEQLRQREQDLLEEWEFLRESGVSIEEAATRLETTVYTLKHLEAS